MVTNLERIARHVKPINKKKLHFVCLGHEETVRDLLGKGFNSDTGGGRDPQNAESVRVDIDQSTNKNDAHLRMKYHGETAELGFDKDTRGFYRNHNNS